MRYLASSRAFVAIMLSATVMAGSAPARTLDFLQDFDASGQLVDRSTARVESLLAVLRDYGDFKSVLRYFDDQIHTRPITKAVRAAALASDGDVARAQEVLDNLTAARDSDWALVAEALIARHSGNFGAANLAVSQALSKAVGNAYVHNVAGTIDAVRGDWNAAAAHFAEAVRLAPEGAIYVANLGGANVNRGDYGPASLQLNRAIDLNGAFCAPRLARATLYDLQGNIEGLEKDLKACLAAEKSPDAAHALIAALTKSGRSVSAAKALATYGHLLDDAQAKSLEAELALQTGDPDRALASLQDAELKEPLRLMNEIYAYLLQGRYAVALEQAERVASETPGNRTLVTLRRGVEIIVSVDAPERVEPVEPLDAFFEALATGDPRRQRDMWVQTEGLVPGFSITGLPLRTLHGLSVQAHRDDIILGMLFLERGMNVPASDAFGVAVSKLAETGGTQASAAPVLFLQAAALARAGERKGAEAALGHAIELAPGFLSAYVFLGDVLARQARFTEALAAAQAAFAIKPSPAHALRLGATAEQVGEVKTAIGAYRQLIKQLPDNHVGYNQLAWVLVSNRLDLDEAEQLARAALKIAPEDGPSLDTLGWILFQQGRVEKALPYLRQAYAMGGTSVPLVAYHLAQAEAMAGDQQRARELYDLILSYGADAFVFSAEARMLRDKETK